MTKEEFITERTRIISEMLDYPNANGIYPTTKCFKELDDLFDKIQSSSVERYVTALTIIAYPIEHFREQAKQDGLVMDGEKVMQLSNHAPWLRSIAQKALEDE